MAIRRIEGLLHLASEGRYAILVVVSTASWLNIYLKARSTH
jgi:hypothetical protein